MKFVKDPSHIIVLGDGKHILSRGTYHRAAALFIEPTDNPKPAGTMSHGPEDEHPHGPEQLSEGSTLITFGTRASLDALILTLQELADSDTGRALP